MELDSTDRLSTLTKTLHWLVAVFIIGLLSVGVYMTETETGWLYPWHKSFGFIALFIVIIRVLWRIKNGWPHPVAQYSSIEQGLATWTHWVLIIATVMLPVSGLLMSYFGGHGLDVFGLEVIARQVNPDNPATVIAHSKALASFFNAVHYWSGYIIIAAITVHIAGALKHHCVDKDETMRRML